MLLAETITVDSARSTQPSPKYIFTIWQTFTESTIRYFPATDVITPADGNARYELCNTYRLMLFFRAGYQQCVALQYFNGSSVTKGWVLGCYLKAKCSGLFISRRQLASCHALSTWLLCLPAFSILALRLERALMLRQSLARVLRGILGHISALFQ